MSCTFASIIKQICNKKLIEAYVGAYKKNENFFYPPKCSSLKKIFTRLFILRDSPYSLCDVVIFYLNIQFTYLNS
jgi:hypothetical protein